MRGREELMRDISTKFPHHIFQAAGLSSSSHLFQLFLNSTRIALPHSQFKVAPLHFTLGLGAASLFMSIFKLLPLIIFHLPVPHIQKVGLLREPQKDDKNRRKCGELVLGSKGLLSSLLEMFPV